jgi:hypothetical protein
MDGWERSLIEDELMDGWERSLIEDEVMNGWIDGSAHSLRMK